MLHYQISLSFAHEETQKCRTNTKDSNCQQQHGDKEFALPNWFLRISNIQGYFDFFIKNNETINDNSPMQVYVNQNEKSVTFKIKSEC